MNKSPLPTWAGNSEALLKALHILTRDGKLNADSRRKLKQVQHLVRLISPFLDRTAQDQDRLHLVDLGAGKSYLGFLLYDLHLRNLPGARVTSVESRPELVESAERLARDSGFDRMRFVCSPISSTRLPDPVDFVCALHACDTATDDAIRFGLSHGARGFALVPCCQAELASQLEELPAASRGALIQHPLHRREFGSHLTNVIRCLHLGSLGYQVTVTELVGWEHSLKNELILAEKKSDPDHPESRKAREALDSLLREFPVKPALLRERT